MNELKQRIKDGLDGKYQGLNNGFEDLNKVLFGIQQKCYTLVGGLSGTYKTTLVDYMVFNAIEDAESKGIPIDVFYYSFEIDKLTKQCNYISQAVFKKYGITIPPEKVKGLGKNRLNKDEEKLVDDVIPEVEEIFGKINFRFEPINPTGIRNEIFKHCEQHGTIHREEYEGEGGKTETRISGYTPNEFKYTLVVIDHLYLMKKENKFTTKENMDKMSEYFVYLRNLFNVSPIVVQQFNQGLNAVDRQKYKGIDISPAQTDFKDTTNPYQDADVVLGIMNPFKLDMESYLNYKVNIFRDRMVALKVIKNRLSRDNVAKGLLAHPESGTFEELPIASEIDYNQYTNE